MLFGGSLDKFTKEVMGETVLLPHKQPKPTTMASWLLPLRTKIGSVRFSHVSSLKSKVRPEIGSLDH